mmetsp:Transcript_122772/g.281528  ORF Transcript_122772/g.281528 Transcript_122772/m.281528 type:complete len:101 (-) Transcript_122772:688-990(-)
MSRRLRQDLTDAGEDRFMLCSGMNKAAAVGGVAAGPKAVFSYKDWCASAAPKKRSGGETSPRFPLPSMPPGREISGTPGERPATPLGGVTDRPFGLAPTC